MTTHKPLPGIMSVIRTGFSDFRGRFRDLVIASFLANVGSLVAVFLTPSAKTTATYLNAVIATFFNLVIIALLDRDHKRTVAQALGIVIRRILPLFLLSVTVGFIVFGNYLFFIIPGLIISLQIIFVHYVCIIEEKGILASIRQSKAYVKGRWWKLFFQRLAYQVPYAVAILLTGVTSFSKNPAVNIAGILVSILISPLALAITAAHYRAFRDSAVLPHPLPSLKRTFAFATIGLVFGFLLPTGLLILINPQAQIRKTNDTMRISNLILTRKAAEQYHTENGTYPANIEALENKYMLPLPTDQKAAIMYKTDPGDSYTVCTTVSTLKAPICLSPGTPDPAFPK